MIICPDFWHLQTGWFIIYNGNPIKHGMIWGVKPPLFLVQHPYGLWKTWVFPGIKFPWFSPPRRWSPSRTSVWGWMTERFHPENAYISLKRQHFKWILYGFFCLFSKHQFSWEIWNLLVFRGADWGWHVFVPELEWNPEVWPQTSSQLPFLFWGSFFRKRNILDILAIHSSHHHGTAPPLTRQEAVDSFLREGWRQERRASLERRSVDSSISVDKVNCPHF